MSKLAVITTNIQNEIFVDWFFVMVFAFEYKFGNVSAESVAIANRQVEI